MEEFPKVPNKHYREICHDVRSGDILLCSGNSIFSQLIQKVTNSVWSHVAFILRLDPLDRIMVLESVESIGVRTVPLSNYVSDYNATRKGYPGRLMIARHLDVREENIAKMSIAAIDFLGFPYGKEEIIRIAARISMHSLGLENTEIDNPFDKHEFICSEYAYLCFQSIGVTFDFNSKGFIAPADFAKHPKVRPLYYVNIESEEATCAPLHGKVNRRINTTF